MHREKCWENVQRVEITEKDSRNKRKRERDQESIDKKKWDVVSRADLP